MFATPKEIASPAIQSVVLEVFTAVAMKSSIVSVLMPCSSDTVLRFGPPYRLHLQGPK
jgi:hypothetical protein